MDQTLTIEDTRQKLVDQFWDSIPPAWKIVRNHLHITAMEKFEVTEEQWHVLRHIRKGADSVSKLAEIKRITRSAVSQSVDLLVEKGLVERAQSASDRRYFRLSLTREGNDLLNAIFQINRAWMLEKLAWLDEEQIAVTIQGMQYLKQALSQSED